MGKGKEKELHHVPIWGLENNNNNNNNNNEENKKWMHRETERQRRQEMGMLCATLRSLLPLEYIKGKRSTSDHMYEAVNYINQLQNKVKKLQAKRDELKKHFSDLNAIDDVGDGDDDESVLHLPPYVVVHPLQGVGGVEITCSYSFKKCLCPLSRLLHILIGEGLNIINTISTKKNGRFIHTIQSEDPNMSSGGDYSELQRKLTEAISSSSSSSLQEQTLIGSESCLLYLNS